jgi:hypothetical protein
LHRIYAIFAEFKVVPGQSVSLGTRNEAGRETYLSRCEALGYRNLTVISSIVALSEIVDVFLGTAVVSAAWIMVNFPRSSSVEKALRLLSFLFRSIFPGTASTFRLLLAVSSSLLLELSSSSNFGCACIFGDVLRDVALLLFGGFNLLSFPSKFGVAVLDLPDGLDLAVVLCRSSSRDDTRFLGKGAGALVTTGADTTRTFAGRRLIPVLPPNRFIVYK